MTTSSLVIRCSIYSLLRPSVRSRISLIAERFPRSAIIISLSNNLSRLDFSSFGASSSSFRISFAADRLPFRFPDCPGFHAVGGVYPDANCPFSFLVIAFCLPFDSVIAYNSQHNRSINFIEQVFHFVRVHFIYVKFQSPGVCGFEIFNADQFNTYCDPITLSIA